MKSGQTLLNDFLGLDSGLTIRCRVSDPTSSSGGSEVGSQMRSLLLRKAFHGVVFRVGNCKFFAHRAVVAARCPKLSTFTLPKQAITLLQTITKYEIRVLRP